MFTFTIMSHWRSHRGKHWRHVHPLPSLGAYSVTQNSAKMHQNTPFSHQKSENFRGRGHSPLPRSLPRGGWDTPPHTPPLKYHTTTRSWLRHAKLFSLEDKKYSCRWGRPTVPINMYEGQRPTFGCGENAISQRWPQFHTRYVNVVNNARIR